MDVPKQVQDKLAQFQNLQNQLQMVATQKQQFMLRNADIEGASQELSKAGEGKIYRMAGTLFVETNKGDCEKNLGEEKESNESRVNVLENQEKKLTQKLNELKGELQGMLGQGNQ
ncbi:MAG: prefoldin subunit beta [Candidatus Altiarchaeales archaeon]|nr:prefoldin subunit beta [Candidatus Altiarchaeales archaeon]